MPTLHGEVTDAVGDGVPNATVPIPPDLVHATADVVGQNLTFVIQCTPGTCSGQTTYFVIEMDTDPNPLTPQFRGMPVQWEYLVNTLRSSVGNVGPIGGPFTGIPVSFIANGVSVTVPLSMIGNDDGRMDFRILASGDPNLPGGDAMPDENLSPGRIQ